MTPTEKSANYYDLASEDLMLASAIAFPDFSRDASFSPGLFSDERIELARGISHLGAKAQAVTADNLRALTKPLPLSEPAILAFDQAMTVKDPPHGKALELVNAKLRTLATRRKASESLREVHGEITSLDSSEIMERVHGVTAGLQAVVDEGSMEELHDGSDMGDVIAEMKWRIENPGKLRGMEFGYTAMEVKLDGLQPGRLVTVGGRPGTGKTTTALNLIRGPLQDGKQGAIFSLEMTATQLKQGLLDIHSGISVPVGKIPTKHELTTIKRAIVDIKGWRYRVDDSDRMSIDRICAKARMLKYRSGLDFIVVDYLQIVTPSPEFFGDMRQGLNEITGKLKALAKELGICVIALSQINRSQAKTNPETGKNIYGRPSLSQLKESSSIESDSDVVILLHREMEDEDDSATASVIAILAKNRQTGMLLDIPLEFDKTNRRLKEETWKVTS